MEAPGTPPSSAAPGSGGVVVPRRLRWHQRAGATFAYLFMRALGGTVRYRWQDESGLLAVEKNQNVIFCVWHNRLALALQVKEIYLKRIGRPCRLAAMVSASKDGGILARILEHYGAQPVRGSTSRRGRQALLELTGWAEQGYDLAITPDGPRGPCYVVQHGVISLAQITGLPIVPVSYSLRPKIRLRSWDRFQVPVPFARCVMKFAPPLWVPREAAEPDRAELRKLLESRLRAITND